MSPAEATARAARSAPASTPEPRRPRVAAVPDPKDADGRLARLAASLHVGDQLGRIGMLAAIALFVSVFGVVIFQTLIVQGQGRLDNLNAHAAEEQQRNEALRQQVADLEAPERIVGAARDRLGLVPPGSVEYLTPNPDDATASAYTPPATTTPTTTPAKPKTTTSTTTRAATTPTTTKSTTSTTTTPTSTTTTTKPRTTTTTKAPTP